MNVKERGIKNRTDKVVPLGVEFRVVSEAALHDVDAVVGAGLHLGQSLAVRAARHLGQRPDAVCARRYLPREERRLGKGFGAGDSDSLRKGRVFLS